MRKFHVFLNTSNGALVLISENNPDFMFYEETHEDIKCGNRRDCVQFIEEYRDVNYIPDDEFNLHCLN